MDDSNTQLIKEFLPNFLNLDQKDNLFKEVRDKFPSSGDQYLLYKDNEIGDFYQGDCIKNIPFPELNLKNKGFDYGVLNGMIISNTCDIAPANKRDFFQPYVQIASIFELEEYITDLRENKISEARISGFVERLMKNEVSTLFYLPKIKTEDCLIFPESFVKFDQVASVPSTFLSRDFINPDYASKGGHRILTLSMYGFYLFLVKLSIHFCRVRDTVIR